MKTQWLILTGGALVMALACAPRGTAESRKTGGEFVVVDGDLPCDVDRILAKVCQHCHTSPPRNGAPFALVTYSDTQQKIDGRPIYEYMGIAVGAGRMPLPPMSLTPTERTILVAWTGDGGKPLTPGTSCALADAGENDGSNAVRDAGTDSSSADGAADAEADADEDAGS